MLLRAFFLGLLTVANVVLSQNQASRKPSFSIDYKNDRFLLDGEPFRYVSGSFHYFRTPYQRWRDILQKMRAAGLNAVSTYVEWSLHEPEFDEWSWEGNADIIRFIKTAQEEGLFVILRPGPYICAERDFGGFPYWLLSKHSDIKLRTDDKRFMYYAERFLDQILTKVEPLFRANGGPIIMVQVENEYGSFYSCNQNYKNKMHEIFYRHVQEKAVLFTTDGSSVTMLKCGSVFGIYPTVDFGSGSNVTARFRTMRQYAPQGPLINSEFYSGWLTHWGEKFQRASTHQIIATFEDMLALNASVNFYMFYGGTNFGFSSGANINANYWPQLTSYDYDAPLTEAGDPTEKYFKIRETIAKYLPMPNLKSPTVALKGDYGTVNMHPVLDLFTTEAEKLFGTAGWLYNELPTFESLKKPLYLAKYEIQMSSYIEGNGTLKAIVKDRAFVYVNGVWTNTLSRMDKKYSCPLQLGIGNSQLKMLVENMGRVNFGNVDVEDFKGVFNLTVENAVLKGPWMITGYTLASVSASHFNNVKNNTIFETGKLFNGPQFLVGQFYVLGKPRDSFFNSAGWGKGVLYINGYNLGRYWPLMGPQMTLYVPKEYLVEGENNLVLLELERVPKNRTVNFQVEPMLDYPAENL